VFVATSSSPDRLERTRVSDKLESGVFLHRSAFSVSDSVEINASGAGDAFSAGIIAQLVQTNGGECGIAALVDAGLASALHRLDNTLVNGPAPIGEVLVASLKRKRITPRESLKVEKYQS